MPASIASLDTIEDFLAQKRIAVVGLSRSPASFSASVFREFAQRGYDVVPVNPHADEILGRKCLARVQDIHPPVTAALLMTAPEVTDAVVRDCAQAGVRLVWMHRAGGAGAVSDNAVAFCEQNGIRVVPGQCPLMFLPGAASFHRFHGFIRKITGRYPKHAHA
ncbi:MAG TPA: CoA-binding protein [Candidatus Eremiobacteraceae bacterium]|nr:CoA-binding protein [Candidatus Eremiobacteraceae bacterium]